MADRNDASLSMIASGGATERAHTTGTGETRGGSVVTEFMDAARSAAESLLEEQKQQVADRIAGFADAFRGAAHPLDQSQSRIIARYLEEAANQAHTLAHSMRQRRWNELVADAEDFARRRPTLFVLGSVAVGFVIGRLLWTSTVGQEQRAGWSSGGSEPGRSVTAAVASGPGTTSGGLGANTTLRAGAAEAR